MKIKKIPEYHRFPYEKTCKCGKKFVLLSQKNDDPEYYTSLYLLCECGEYVKFNIPVN
jgi:hypothetical protein